MFHVEGLFIDNEGHKFACTLTVLDRPWMEPQYEIIVKDQSSIATGGF